MKTRLPEWCLGGVMSFGSFFTSALAETWQQTGAPSVTWRSVACSSDGNRVLAAGDEGIYESLDAGLTWLFLNPTQSFSVACSADGTQIVADGFEAGSGAIDTSPNSGATWQAHLFTPAFQYYVASSADGTKLVVAGYDGNFGSIYLSADSGNTWILPQGPTNFWSGNIWSAVASSADGTKLAAVAESTVGNGSFLPGPIYTSTNSGATWILSSAPSNVWYSVACSADGTKLVAAAYAGPAQIAGTGLIYTSNDSGNTWTNAIPPANYWMSVASSADGTHLFAASLFDQNVENSGVIWESTNSGVNWSENALTGNFSSIATSADGSKLVVSDVVLHRIYTFGEAAVTAPPRFRCCPPSRLAINCP